MTRRANRLLVLALAVISVSMYFGCSQTDDILTPVKRTVMTLDPQLLPTAPAGMVYELWVAGASDTLPVDRFNYDEKNLIFLNEDMTPRDSGGAFFFDHDLLTYSEVLVSVELTSDPSPTSPGPIMLEDQVTNPADNPIKLVFPLSDSLWFATCRYNMETPSDGNRSNSGAGVWFCTYQLISDSIQDTLGVFNVTETDSSVANPKDTCITTYDSTHFDTLLDTVVVGFDTILHNTVRASLVGLRTVCQPPWNVHFTDYSVGLGVLHRYVADSFSQDNFGLIDYPGWHYKGWVVSPVVRDLGASVGPFTPPPWPASIVQLMIGATDGGLISTGTFRHIDQPDDGNPYSLGPRVPPYPGEDFLQNLPIPPGDTLNLVPLTPYPEGNGAVFITLEPDNYTDTTTNFPLVVFVGKIPLSRSAIEASIGGTVQINMDQFTNTNLTDLGFPRIDVHIVRQ